MVCRKVWWIYEIYVGWCVYESVQDIWEGHLHTRPEHLDHPKDHFCCNVRMVCILIQYIYTFGNNNKSAGVPWYQRSEKCLKMIKWILGFFSSLSFPLELLDARNMVSFFVASPSGSLTCPSWRKVSWFRSFRCQLAAAGALSISRLDLLVRGGAALRKELHCGGALKSTVEHCGTKRLTRERESCPCTNAPLLQPL